MHDFDLDQNRVSHLRRDAVVAIASLGTVDAVRMFFPWFGNRHGEGHDEISTDRLGGGIVSGRSYVCHGSKWPRHRRIPTGAMESQSQLSLLQLPLCPASLCARTAVLCSGLSGTTLRLQTLAPLVVNTIGVCVESRGCPRWIRSGHPEPQCPLYLSQGEAVRRGPHRARLTETMTVYATTRDG